MNRVHYTTHRKYFFHHHHCHISIYLSIYLSLGTKHAITITLNNSMVLAKKSAAAAAFKPDKQKSIANSGYGVVPVKGGGSHSKKSSNNDRGDNLSMEEITMKMSMEDIKAPKLNAPSPTRK